MAPLHLGEESALAWRRLLRLQEERRVEVRLVRFGEVR